MNNKKELFKIETGSSKSLFTMIAVVIFGIFLSLSYWLFQDEMQGVLASVVDGVNSVTLVTMDKTLVGDYELGGSETPNIPEEVLVPNAESDFLFDITTGTITGYKGARKDVVIPSTIKGTNVLIIGTDSFREQELTSVYIPDGVVKVDTRAFYINSIETARIPDSVTSIKMAAFGHNKLTTIDLPTNLTSLNYSSFAYNQLTHVEFPEGLTSIYNHSFADNKITSIILPESVTSIGSEAFLRNQLTSLDLPSGLTSIDYDAFRGNQLTSVYIPRGVKVLSRGEFAENPLTTVEMASGTSYKKVSDDFRLPTFPDGVTITYYPR